MLSVNASALRLSVAKHSSKQTKIHLPEGMNFELPKVLISFLFTMLLEISMQLSQLCFPSKTTNHKMTFYVLIDKHCLTI